MFQLFFLDYFTFKIKLPYFWDAVSLPYMQIVSSKHWATPVLLRALFSWGYHLETLPVCVVWGCGVRISTGTGGVLGRQSIVSWAGIWTLQRFPWQEPCHAAFLETYEEKFQRCVQSFACFDLSRAKERRGSFSNLEKFWYPTALPCNFRTLYLLEWFHTFYHFLKILQEHVGLVWISMENTEASLDFAIKYFEQEKNPKNNICNDCSGILVYLLHIGGRMLLIANTKLVRVLCKLFFA